MTPDTIDFNSLSKKQLVELVITKYNDCFRLEQENKNLNKQIEQFKKGVKAGTKIIERLEEENKKLKEENENLKAIIEHYKKFEEGKNKLEGMLMEEDTLQELRDLGEI